MNIITILILWTIGMALAQESSTCEKKYLRAAEALDQSRAQCGISETNSHVFCRFAGKINIPIEISGVKFTLNVAAAYRFLNQLHLLPNNLRKSAKLIQEAYRGNGARLKRTTKNVAKHLPEVKSADVARVIKKLNKKQSLCPGEQLFSYKQIRFLIED